MRIISLTKKGEIKIEDENGKYSIIKRGTKKITHKDLNGYYKIDSYDVLKIISLLYGKQIFNQMELLTEDNVSFVYNANEVNRKTTEELKHTKVLLAEKIKQLQTLRRRIRANNKRFFKKKISLD